MTQNQDHREQNKVQAKSISARTWLVTAGGLLFFSAFQGQIIDAVGLWVGDLAEGQLVDGGVVGCQEHEDEGGEAEGPGAWWYTNLEARALVSENIPRLQGPWRRRMW